MLRGMFSFAKLYAIFSGHVYDVLYFDRYIYLKSFPPYPAYICTVSTTYLETKIMWASIYIGFWIYIIARDVRGRTNPTCVQLRIPSTYVCLSLEGSIGALVLTLEDSIISPVFDSLFLFKVC